MYAVIQTGGKQYRVSEGDVITVEKLDVEVNSKVEFDKVLLVEDSGDVKIGTPYLDAVKVVGSVLENGKGKKVIIFKYKSKKDYRKKQGHRQPFTMVQIDEIISEGKPKAKKAAPKKEKAEPEQEPAVEVTEAEVTEPKEAAAEPAETTEIEEPKKPAVKRTRAKKEVKEDAPATEEKPEEEKKPAPKRTRVKKEVPVDGE